MSSESTHGSHRARAPWLLALMIAGGCAGFTRGAYWDDEDAGDDGSPPSGSDDDSTGDSMGPVSTYGSDVHPLMLDGCERCHSPNGAANGTGFIVLNDDVDASYTSTVSFVDVDDPPSSRLLSKAAGTGHGGGTIFDTRSAEYAATLNWIAQGAMP